MEIPPMSLPLPSQPFDAVIFDCDGTLVDSMPLHFVAWTQSLEHHRAPFSFSEDYFYAKAGVREQDVVALLNAEHGCNLDPESVADHKSKLFHQIIHQVREIKPVADFARSLQGIKPMAVASGSEEPLVRTCLAQNGLLHLFEERIITPRLVSRGKPAPDMFLLAAERMGIEPSRCLVIEDGQSGIEAAKAAGMNWVFVERSLR
jgi:HAD superfamily hydrolase (TIGR01509 family)